jgi:gas vesicle protein
MGETPEELRGQLASKREDLTRDLEAIGDRVSPGRVVERRQAAVRMRVSDVKDRVMGAKDVASDHLHESAATTADTMTDAVHRVGDSTRSHTEGSPLAAGMVAFGLGLVAASVFPATRREKQMAAQAQPALEGAVAQIAPTAKQIANDVRPAAKEAISDIGDNAKEAAAHVKDEARDAAAEAKESAKAAAQST